MNTLISNLEYENLLRKKVITEYKVVVYIMAFMALLFAGLTIYISNFELETFLEEGFFLLIPMVIVIIVAIIFAYQIKNISNKPSPHFSFDRYVEYETEGKKVPLFRVINYGRSSETVYLILEITQSEIKLFDIRRRGLIPYIEGNISETSFKFYFKIKHGMEEVSSKLDIICEGKRKRIYGFKEINELLLNYLKNEGIKYVV